MFPATGKLAFLLARLAFTMPIWITPPAKVKQLGVIEKIVMSVFDETGSISDGIIDAADPMATVSVTPGNFGVLILNNTAKLLAPAEGVTETSPGSFDRTGEPVSWFKLLDQYPGKFRAGLSTIRLAKADGNEIVATASVNPTDETEIVLNFDSDTVPENTILTDSITSRGTVDAIIDPLTFNPDLDNLAQGTRYLIGLSPKPGDMIINVMKGKKLTNMRTQGTDENVVLTPVRKMSIAEQLSMLNTDEALEITPDSCRLRKAILDPHERKKSEKSGAAA